MLDETLNFKHLILSKGKRRPRIRMCCYRVTDIKVIAYEFRY
jgi:hypothetical protein